MLPAFVLLSLTALAISTVIGFFTNSFIIVAHGMDRAKGRNINPRELILFTLGLFNIAYQFSMVANDTVLYLWSDLYFSDNVYTIFSVLLLFTIFSSFWFTFCLCGFYYVMLGTFEKTLFMRLKQNISDVVPWMLLSSVFLSLFISVPVTWNIKKDEYTAQYNENVTDNSTTQQGTPHMSLQYLLVTSIIGCCIPLILVAISNILIIKSLCLHAKHLRKNTGGMSVQSVEASVSAACTVTSLLLLYISFYVSQILLIMAIFDVDSIWFSVCLLVIYAYSPVQSIILILGSPKLKSALVKFFNSSVFNKNRSPSENIKQPNAHFAIAFKQKLKEALDKYEQDIIHKKRGKFHRDRTDFEGQSAFKWKHYGNPRSLKGLKSASVSSCIAPLLGTFSSSDSFLSSTGSDLNVAPNVGAGGGLGQATSSTLHVINLSVHILSPCETSILERSLTFSPTQSIDNFMLVKDLYLFCKRLVFQTIYRKLDMPLYLPEDKRQAFRDLLDLQENKLTAAPAIKIFFDLVKKDIMDMPIRALCPCNLTPTEKKALLSLKNNKCFLIKEAEK
ncbi:taste receptor type 2 member 40-like [Phyllobates terribilis]|uniref:taste receptor type 2 member 40-like n=1 Tax=Phyllobates terribilis TaxID=111132 RepID=UPI003CCAB324